MDQEKASAYWKRNVNLILALLAVWALVSLGAGIVFAPALNNFSFFQLPLGFWFAQQGSMFVFVILIFVYARMMDNLDSEFGLREE